MSSFRVANLRSSFRNLFGIDVRTLALMRVGFALLIMLDLFNRAFALVAHYTDFGVLPREALFEEGAGSWIFSLHTLSGYPGVQALLFLIAFVCAVLLLLGYKTKVVTVLSWLLLLSLQNRNPYVLQASDAVLRLSLFWGMFLPWGEAYSVDSALKIKSTSKQEEGSRTVFTVATAAFLLQIAFVYIFTVILKTSPIWRTEGTAIFYALNIDQFVTPLGQLLLNLPLPVLTMLSLSVFWIEAIAPYLLFFPWGTSFIRLLVLGVLIPMHLGFGLTMDIGLFSLTSFVSLLVFLPPLFWEKIRAWRRKVSPSANITFYYDGDCGFCWNMVRIVKVFLMLDAKLVSAQNREDILRLMMEKNSWVVEDEKGSLSTGFAGVVSAIKVSPVFFLLARFFSWQPVMIIGEKIYRFIADHRKRVCEEEKLLKPSRHYEKTSALVAFSCLLLVFFWNLSTLPNKPISLPQPIKTIITILRLDQSWGMFAPFPLRDDGWYVIPGFLKDGSVVNLFPPSKEGKELTFEKPENIVGMYSSQRWRKYMMNLWMAPYIPQRKNYAAYLCREWNSTHPPEKHLLSLHIIFMIERTFDDGPRTPEAMTLIRYQCE